MKLFGGYRVPYYFRKKQNAFFNRRQITTFVQRKARRLCVKVSTKKHHRIFRRLPKRDTFFHTLLGSIFQRRRVKNLLQAQLQRKKCIGQNVLSNYTANKNTLSVKCKTKVVRPEEEDGDNKIVTLDSLRRKPSLFKRKCFGPPCQMGRCSLFSKGKILLFMMQKRFSLFTVHGRLQSQKLKIRNRNCKLVEPYRHRLQRDFLSLCRKSLRDKVHKAVSFLKSKLLRPALGKSRPSDMNNNTSGILCENQQCSTNNCLNDETGKLPGIDGQLVNVVSSNPIIKNRHPIHSSNTQWETGISVSRKANDIPAEASYPEDVRNLVAEKEISVSSKEDADGQRRESDDLMLLTDDKLQLSLNKHAECQGSNPVETMENCDDSSHMDVDESINSDMFNTKLLDHPYCKSPPQDFLPEDSLAVQGVKNCQNIVSCISEEQLSSCLYGLCNELLSFISKEIMKYKANHSKTMSNFRVYYNKHMLDLDDLSTLDGQNWLNDQVINMYGELIMDAVPEKVHFLNSFFHRQLVTKGYNGVKRWTKKVDFFKKTLLLIPIHLEVHWSLITVNIPHKMISFYDSQGIHFKFCVENIRKYLITEAREKNHPEFLQGWQTTITKCIPQQKNDSDCGVFVLQYCKCLALEQPFQFSQDDMPRVRKRIYKELCECRLMD
ncbi:hypothetical protein GDO86_010026 [Hymenochirus boettgeri]|uniref:Ubiquitin-like protease family profile domain-containing protein n=1 Tax=Hymenochirus boettgeri TaxID=247094 RepID=A0A8T2JIV4_9PIPI|nr:hypothetical protein GDO86_010026 [Hymenochirus boettgeri]